MREQIKLPVTTTPEGYVVEPDTGWPWNVSINKVRTAVGMTHNYLTSNDNIILAVPLVEIITNKTGQEIIGENGKGFFGAFGNYGKVKEKMELYLQTRGTDPIKILITWDMIPKLLADFPGLAECSLVIDEYHQILKAADYRSMAISGLLKTFDKFNQWVFISATPIPLDFMPEKMENIKEVVLEYPNDGYKLTGHRIKTNSPLAKIKGILEQYRDNGYYEENGHKSTEAFVYINSVDTIIRLCRDLNLTPNNTRIICSAGDKKNLEKLSKTGIAEVIDVVDVEVETVENVEINTGELFPITEKQIVKHTEQREQKSVRGFDISTTLSKPKLITFLTCKAYEGCDIFSESGLPFIVSVNTATQTAVDIMMDVIQIMGRIRTLSNPFRRHCVLIMQNTFPNELEDSYTDFRAKRISSLAKLKKLVEFINLTNDDDGDLFQPLIEKSIKDGLVDFDDDKGIWRVNDIRIKNEINRYKTLKWIYSDDKEYKSELNKAGIDCNVFEYVHFDDDQKFKIEKLDLLGTTVEKSLRLLYDTNTSLVECEAIIDYFPDLELIWNNLTLEDCEKAEFNKAKMERIATIKRADKHHNYKIQKVFGDYAQGQGTVTVDNAKAKLQELYDSLGLEIKAQINHLSIWFDYKECIKKVRGKQYRAIKILSRNLIYNEKRVFNEIMGEQ